MADEFSRSLDKIDADLKAALARRASARTAIDRRQGDMKRALADIEGYERQAAQADQTVDGLLAERSRSKATAEECPATLDELMDQGS